LLGGRGGRQNILLMGRGAQLKFLLRGEGARQNISLRGYPPPRIFFTGICMRKKRRDYAGTFLLVMQCRSDWGRTRKKFAEGAGGSPIIFAEGVRGSPKYFTEGVGSAKFFVVGVRQPALTSLLRPPGRALHRSSGRNPPYPASRPSRTCS
jgi:hypothetical protein